MPLEKKWVITISTQHGCSMRCRFCDAWKVGTGINVREFDLLGQISEAMALHPEVEHTERLNIHFARMGEPTFNRGVISATEKLKTGFLDSAIRADVIHPVVSTMLPNCNPDLVPFLMDWMRIKNGLYNGEAGLQFSINSTNNASRNRMFSENSLSLNMIANIGEKLPYPVGRKITLNFALSKYEINAKRLAKMFDPDKFCVKITPMHRTRSAVKNNILTEGDAASYVPYKEIEEELKDAGFDVIVFIASDAEDMSKITCGNAVLASGNPVIPADMIQ